MYKFLILIITLFALSLAHFGMSLMPLDSFDPELHKIFLVFNDISIIIFGLLVSGILPASNKFEPYHLAKITVAGIYMLIQLSATPLIFTGISFNLLLFLNLSLLFLFGAMLLILNLANSKSSSIRKN